MARVAPQVTFGALHLGFWQIDWALQPGAYSLIARATDGTGAPQIKEERDPVPDGASGYHKVTVIVA